MKKFSILLLFLALSFAVQAQDKADKQVLAAVGQLKSAMISGERAALDEIAAPELSYGHSSGKVEDKATFVESIASGKSDFVSIELKNQNVQVSGKTALVRHELHAKTNDGGKPGEVHLGILLVFQKQHGQWKLLGRQAFKLAY
ncbi:MAG: nuclear transport factor 2 family protein [Pedobacter sp.]|nr:nuclear transport factor 2 family protein [Pedobacter sp.]MDQ8051453.1 nuclear transport factor 2 family protein [Pedobacter sp.]